MDFTLAAQAIDDASDWRRDLASRTPSLITAGLEPPEPGGDGASAVARAADVVLGGGRLRDVLERGRAHLERAATAAVLVSSERWRLLTGKLACAYTGVLALWREGAMAPGPPPA